MNEDEIFVKRPGESQPAQMTGTNTVTRTPVGSIQKPINEEYKAKREAERKRAIKNFEMFGLYTLVYSIFATFCLYKNVRGITFPFFTVGTLVFFYFCIKKTGIEVKRTNAFYMISMLLLGISIFLTEDHQMTGLAKWALFILLLIFILRNIFDDSEWHLFSYLKAIVLYLGKIIEKMGTPFSDSSAFFKERKKIKEENKEENENIKATGKVTYVLIGVVISIPILIIVLNLLCSADAVFKEACDAFIELIEIKNILCILIMMIIVYMIFYPLARFTADKDIEINPQNHRKYEPILAITVTSILTFVYLLFSGIQIMYLFTRVSVPEGYTFAEYAHEGFYELLIVCLINLVIVLVCTNLFRYNKVLNIVLTVFSVCTYIMIASSAYRMILYVETYDLTRLRVYVMVGLAVLSVLMVGVMISIFSEKFNLFKYGIAVLTVSCILLVYSHPSFIIAYYNVDQYKKHGGNIDISYLTELPLDATPVLFDVDNYQLLRESEEWEYSSYSDMKYYCRDFNENDDYADEYICRDMNFRNFNLSKFLAVKSYEKLRTYDFFNDDVINWETF